MTEEQNKASAGKECCSNKADCGCGPDCGCRPVVGGCGGLSGCRCFKLALGVVLVLGGFWMGTLFGRSGKGMACGPRAALMCPCPHAAATQPAQ